MLVSLPLYRSPNRKLPVFQRDRRACSRFMLLRTTDQSDRLCVLFIQNMESPIQTNQNPNQLHQQSNRCLSVSEVAKKLGIGKSTVWQKLKDDPSFPRSFSLFCGGNATRWLEIEIDNFIMCRVQASDRETSNGRGMPC